MHTKYVSQISILIIATFLIVQTVWLADSYYSHVEKFKQTINFCLRQAVDMELSHRLFSGDKDIGFYILPIRESDFTTFVFQFSQDTVVRSRLTFDKDSVYTLSQQIQPALMSAMPLNIQHLCNIFNELLLENRISVRQVKIKYMNPDEDTIIEECDAGQNVFSPYESDILIDADHSSRIIVEVESPYWFAFKKMLPLMLISLLVIFLVPYLLFNLLQIINKQNLIESKRTDYLQIVSHDFARPISSAYAKTESAISKLEKKQIEEALECLDQVVSNLKKMSRYSTEIGDMAMKEIAGVQIKKTTFPVKEILEDIKERNMERYPDKNIQITWEMEEYLHLFSDPFHFSHIIENLVENSIKYSTDNVKITITVIREEKQTIISVWDNGWGIPKNEIAKIFDKFYRIESHALTVKKGFGIGLSYVKSMTEALGGNVFVTSLQGSFTQFILIFPN